MQPILVNNIRFRRNKIGKLGLPKKYTVALFADHIAVSRKNNTDSENIPISEIAKAALANGVIVTRLNDGQSRSFYFESLSQKIGSGPFIGGAVGGILAMKSGKNKAAAEAWLEQLKALGVDTVKV